MRYAALLLLCGACSSETTPPPEDNPDADACEHLSGGPFSTHAATADMASAPDIAQPHRAHTITLIDNGYVAFAAAEGGEYIFYSDADVAMTFDGLAWEDDCASGCSDACGEIVGRRVVDITQVGTYHLQFAPALVDRVTIVHVLAGDHGHE